MFLPPGFPPGLSPKISAEINALRRRHRNDDAPTRIKAQAFAFTAIAYEAVREGKWNPLSFEDGVRVFINWLCQEDQAVGMWDREEIINTVSFGSVQSRVLNGMVHDRRWQKYLEGVAAIASGDKKAGTSEARHALVDPILTHNGWSIGDWANKAGVAYHTADNWLSGRKKSYKSTIQKLAKALNIPVEKLP